MNGRMLTSLAGFLCFTGIFFFDSMAQKTVDENIVLGKPTKSSVLVHMLVAVGTEVAVEYGPGSGVYTDKTDAIYSAADGVTDIAIVNLTENTRYFYRVNYRAPGESSYRVGEEYTFHTQRTKGSSFSFGVQGDSHPERLGRMYSPDLYARTMERVAGDRPDLYFMLGDDFSISNQLPNYFQGDRSTLTQSFVDDIYINQRRFLGIMANSTALFLVNGNHEEARRSLLGTPLHDVSIFAGRARNRYFPVPTPDDFYTGNPEPVDGIGLLGDYFAFKWGDALFISLDPYWHSPRVTEPIGGMGTGSASLGQQPSANVGGMGVGMG
ncbi:MAG: fibronectin type III domain-containing protein, partial [Gammaproteobacteria bacterium]